PASHRSRTLIAIAARRTHPGPASTPDRGECVRPPGWPCHGVSRVAPGLAFVLVVAQNVLSWWQAAE
ncbi:MAG TPA: hypothetical protein VJY65_07195, partial [Chloroflexota bacterium]|nr:hypothetical protein [Chloroflexota bacterium]